MNAPKELFSWNARYLIAPDAASASLMDDVTIFLDSACALAKTVAAEVDGTAAERNPDTASLAYLLYQTIQMASGSFVAAHSKLFENGIPRLEADPHARALREADSKDR